MLLWCQKGTSHQNLIAHNKWNCQAKNNFMRAKNIDTMTCVGKDTIGKVLTECIYVGRIIHILDAICVRLDTTDIRRGSQHNSIIPLVVLIVLGVLGSVPCSLVVVIFGQSRKSDAIPHGILILFVLLHLMVELRLRKLLLLMEVRHG